MRDIYARYLCTLFAVVASDVPVNDNQDNRTGSGEAETDGTFTNENLDVQIQTPDRRRTMLPRMEAETKTDHAASRTRRHTAGPRRVSDVGKVEAPEPKQSIRNRVPRVEAEAVETIARGKSRVEKVHVSRPNRRRKMLPRVDTHEVPMPPRSTAMPSRPLAGF